MSIELGRRGELYLQAFKQQEAANDKIAKLTATVECQRAQIEHLHSEIKKVGDWFMQETPELIEEGSACDLAVRWLNYFVLDRDIPVPASPDVMEFDCDADEMD